MDSATKDIFFAGYTEAPKGIKKAVTPASVATAWTKRLMAPGRLKVEAATAEVGQDFCTICGICVKVCPYNAISVDVKTPLPTKAKKQAARGGCEPCAAECPSEVIPMHAPPHRRPNQGPGGHHPGG